MHGTRSTRTLLLSRRPRTITVHNSIVYKVIFNPFCAWFTIFILVVHWVQHKNDGIGIGIVRDIFI